MNCVLYLMAQFGVLGGQEYQTVMNDKEKDIRSSDHNIESDAAPINQDAEGVGGRQGYRHPALRGGGYLNNCTNSKIDFSLDVDPRFSILRLAGLAPVWLEIAHSVGFDQFVSMWEKLGAANISSQPTIKVMLTSFTKFKKAARNFQILRMAGQGVRPEIIKQRLLREHRENLSRRHIERIISQGQNLNND